jgi:FkbM family methyltransferase
MSGVAGKLRPKKVRNAVRRRVFERSLARLVAEESPAVVELGTPYGGWRVPDGVLPPEPIAYCVGSGTDISFDLELIVRYGARVRAIDPVADYESRILASAAGEPRFSFRLAALALEDRPIRMQVHHEPGSSSLSATGLYDGDDWREVMGLTLASLMREFGDERIDLLKVDVEGLEYELIPTLDLRALGVRVFAIQLHHPPGVGAARRLIRQVEDQGFRLVAERPVIKLTFCRRDLLPD